MAPSTPHSPVYCANVATLLQLQGTSVYWCSILLLVPASVGGHYCHYHGGGLLCGGVATRLSLMHWGMGALSFVKGNTSWKGELIDG